MLKLSDLYFLVTKNILEKKKRTFLTISGIIIGIFTFTFFIFVSQGLSNAVFEQFSGLGVNVLLVQSANGGGAGPQSIDSYLTQKDLNKIKQVTRGYNYISPQLFHTDQYEFARQKEKFTTIAFPAEYLTQVYDDLNLEVEFGRPMRSGDKGTIMIGAKVAKEGFKKELKIGSSIKVDEKNFRIIGIIKERGDLFLDNSIHMPYRDLETLSENFNQYSAIRVSLLESTDADLIEEKILKKLNPNNKQKHVTITSPKQAMEQFNQILGVLNLIISFVSSIALFVGGINVMNTMYSNIIERTNEISVMKALGATESDIRNIFLVESSFLGLIGAIFGFLLSFILAKILGIILVNMGYNVPIYFKLSFFLIIILITSFITMLFGTYPALKAAKINPADNLRDE